MHCIFAEANVRVYIFMFPDAKLELFFTLIAFEAWLLNAAQNSVLAYDRGGQGWGRKGLGARRIKAKERLAIAQKK